MLGVIFAMARASTAPLQLISAKVANIFCFPERAVDELRARHLEDVFALSWLKARA